MESINLIYISLTFHPLQCRKSRPWYPTLHWKACKTNFLIR
jgi:hypothetical protein